jgi:hypothetical protein
MAKRCSTTTDCHWDYVLWNDTFCANEVKATSAKANAAARVPPFDPEKYAEKYPLGPMFGHVSSRPLTESELEIVYRDRNIHAPVLRKPKKNLRRKKQKKLEQQQRKEATAIRLQARKVAGAGEVNKSQTSETK